MSSNVYNAFELLYVYIHNINRCYEDTSFTFTNSYVIDYNYETRSLKIKKKQNYLEGFYGEKIKSINLIIGENGSGKTTLLDLIGLKRDDKNHEFNLINDFSCEYFALYKANDDFLVEGTNPELFLNSDDLIDGTDNEYGLYFNYDFSNNTIKNLHWSSSSKSNNLKFVHYNREEKEDFLYNRKNTYNKLDKGYDYTHTICRDYCNLKKFSELYTLLTDHKYVYKKIMNIDMKIKVEIFDAFKSEKISKNEIDYDFESHLYEVCDTHFNLVTLRDKFIYKYLINCCLCEYYNETNSKEYIYENMIKILENKSSDINDIINFIETLLDKDEFDKIYNLIEIINEIPLKFFYENNFDEFESILTKNRLIPVYLLIDFEMKYEKIYEFLEEYDDKYFNVYINNHISDGELSYLKNFLYLYNALNSINEEIKQCIILLDEPDRRFHPRWHSSYINTLVKVINLINKDCKFQIILTTHSPFILSDVPKECINCIKVNGNKREIVRPASSFASNYYDIIKDSFFLDNTIGEFALNKIRNVQKILSNKEYSKEQIYLELSKVLNINKKTSTYEYFNIIENSLIYFIDNIGEPLIKMQLKQLWNEIDNNTNYSLEDLKSKTNEELINIIRGVCNVKD